jgi:uncharacterized BrkB/YihY/UPF0761 family membrane protein
VSPPDESEIDVATTAGWRAFVEARKGQAAAGRSKAVAMFERHRHRPLIDLGLRLYERDRDAAGTVVSSAIAFRIFLFFVPLLLFVVGLSGFFGGAITAEHVDSAGITGSLAVQIDAALNQPNATRWLATLTGLVGMITTGRTLSKVTTQASCLAWRLPIVKRAPVRVVGAIIGLLVGAALISAVVNRVQESVGLTVTALSFFAAVALYVLLWLAVTALLPRPTSDPGVLLPGAILVGVTIATLQAVSQLFLPDRFSHASQLYGAIGVSVVVLGWFFLAGRTMMLSLELNAVMYERFGSVSRFAFGLPVVRLLPRHWGWLRRRFNLDDEAPLASAPPDGAAGSPAPDPGLDGPG